MDTAQYMGNLTTPLALIFIGVTLYSMGLKKIRFDLGLIGICLGRFIIAPLSMYLLSFIFPMPELMFKVFVIMASLPAMIQTVVFLISWSICSSKELKNTRQVNLIRFWNQKGL